MSVTLEHLDGSVCVEELPNGRRLLTATPRREGQYMFQNKLETSYPLDLIQLIIEAEGVLGLCFEIMRDEEPVWVQRVLENDLFAYFKRDDFNGKQILDFGCGSGASTAILARMFPNAVITGVELFPDRIAVARKRAEYYNLSNVSFYQSPSGIELPDNIGQFDFVILSAVYEHLLPTERKSITPKLWSAVREGGYLFINQTPNRLFPFELHTTMLPFINYLPDSLALKMARRFSKRVARDVSWEELLREGIRGATEREILRLLNGNGTPAMLEPKNHGLKDRIDLYYSNTNIKRLQTVKRIARVVIKAIKTVSGITLIPDLSLAFQKLPNNSRK